MRERALLVGGELTIESRPGHGTTVRLKVSELPSDAATGKRSPDAEAAPRLGSPPPDAATGKRSPDAEAAQGLARRRTRKRVSEIAGDDSGERARAEEAAEMRVLIADDHGIVRSGIRLLLERQPDIEVIAEAADGAEARELAVRERPDLAILDVKMPKLTGLQATREIKRAGARGLGPDPLDARRRALPVRGAEGGRLGLRAEGPGRHRPAGGDPGGASAASPSSRPRRSGR